MLIIGLIVAMALVFTQVNRNSDASVPVATLASPLAVASLPKPNLSDATVQAVSPSMPIATPYLPTPTVVVRRVFEMTELTRRLPDEGVALKIGDRAWRVLGSREVVNTSGKQTVLVLRDEASGQLDYRQSALRFVLNAGQDYEDFIRSRSNVTRLFANPLYGDIGVDAANIAAEYSALAMDARVSKVMFIPLEVKPQAK